MLFPPARIEDMFKIKRSPRMFLPDLFISWIQSAHLPGFYTKHLPQHWPPKNISNLWETISLARAGLIDISKIQYYIFLFHVRHMKQRSSSMNVRIFTRKKVGWLVSGRGISYPRRWWGQDVSHRSKILKQELPTSKLYAKNRRQLASFDSTGNNKDQT